MSGITDGYHQDLDEENFDNSETEVDYDEPEPQDDANSESEPMGLDADSDFLHRFAAAVVGDLGNLSEDDPDDDDEIGDDDLEASEEEEEEEAFLTDGFVTVSYVNNKIAFRKGDLQGEIFAYTEIDPSVKPPRSFPQNSGPLPPHEPSGAQGKVGIDGSKLYTSDPSKHPVEIQINHGNFMFFDLAANNQTGALLAEVDQLYDDNGDPVSHALSTENNRPKVTLFLNSELLTPAAKSAPVTLSPSFRPPVVQLPTFRPSSSVGPPQPQLGLSSHRNTPSPPQPMTSFNPVSTHRPPPFGSADERLRAATGSPRSGINQFAPSITGPAISSEISTLRPVQLFVPGANATPPAPQVSIQGMNGSHPVQMSAMTVNGTYDNSHAIRGPPKIRLKIQAPSTPSYIGSSDSANTGRVGNAGGPAGGVAQRLGSLPGVRSVNSYQDLLVIDQGETPNMYASRVYLAGVINEAPLYLLGVERQFTPEAVVVISRMLNNRLWLKTRYSEIHDEILDLLVDICPELNGLPD